MLKRSFDVVFGGAAFVLAAPLLGLIAFAVWVESGRPVLFVQRRIGRHGRPFAMYKFRTLDTGVDCVNTPKMHATRVGTLLRRWGLDELPQLWNVLRGEMSLVGPRPTLPEQVARYGPYERKRLAVRPGLTGWAQVHGRNALSWPERIRLDVWYVNHRSCWLDLRILLRTVPLLLANPGTYGAEGANPDFHRLDRRRADRTLVEKL